MRCRTPAVVVLLALVLASCEKERGPSLVVVGGFVKDVKAASPFFTVDYELRNQGGSELVIANVRKTCSTCTSITLSKYRLLPGEAACLSLTGRTHAQSSLRAAVFLDSNDPVNPIVKLQANIAHAPGYTC